MSSGVRNLRAMFENQNTASPEPRGRSPGDNTTAEEDIPTRPTPKVRASFISVEPTAIPPPDLGATKGTPTNSNAAHRRESFSVSQDNIEEIKELKKEVSLEKEERRLSGSIAEAVPEEAVASRESSIPPLPIRNEPAGEMPNLGSIMKGADFPEPSAIGAEKVPIIATPPQPPQTPAKETKSPAASKVDAPAPSETPAKPEKKSTPATSKADVPAPTPVMTEPEPIKAESKSDPPAPAEMPAKSEKKSGKKSDKKSAKAAKAEVPVEPQATVKAKEEPAAPSIQEKPAPTQLPTEAEEKPEEPLSQEPAAPTETLAKVEEKSEDKIDPAPAPAPVDDASIATQTLSKAEEEPPAAPVEATPSVPEGPAKVQEPTRQADKPTSQVNEPSPRVDEPTLEVDGPIQVDEPTSQVDVPAPTEPKADTVEQLLALQTDDVPADDPDKAGNGAQEEVSLKPTDTDAATVAGGEALPPVVESLPAASTPKAAASKPLDSKAKSNTTPAAKTKPELKKPAVTSTSTSKVASRSPLPKSIPKTPTTPKPYSSTAAKAKASPVAARTKPVVTIPSTVKTDAKPTTTKEATKPAPPKTTGASLHPGGLSAATAPTTSAATKAKTAAPENKKPATAKPAATATAKPATTATTATANVGGFKKPAPKSPTRPVKLPSHLIAPTAASAAKHGEEQKLTRHSSTTTRPKPTVPGTKSSRPSLAPATTAPKRPDSRASTSSAAPKGDFLSRMMRPTTASASKTHEKPASPPRKSTKATASVLPKGKKKAEEVAAKAKDAIISNGHDAEKTSANGVPASDEAAGATNPEPCIDEPSSAQEQATADTPALQADASVVEPQSSETVH